MPIVTVNASAQTAPTPSTVQARGALISQGGTTLAANASSLLTQLSDLTALLAAPLTTTTMTWASGTVTVTAAAALSGLSSGDTFLTTIAGAVPIGYNGTFTATVTGADTFTYPLAVTPGTETTLGTFTPPGQAELVAMATSFFAQGASSGVYVLELGATDATSGIAALSTYLTHNPAGTTDAFYAYLVPREWDGVAAFKTLVADYEAVTAKTYFFTTTTSGNYTGYTKAMKGVLALVEAPGIPATEFSLAAAFQVALSYSPTASKRLAPFGYTYLYGPTPYPLSGNGSLLASLASANVNVVGTGQEGGIATDILTPGNTIDGNDFSYWYAVDSVQINSKIALANAVIAGANDTVNPLWYDDSGILRLQDAEVAYLKTAVSAGLLTGPIVRANLAAADFTAALDAGTYAGQNVVNAEPLAAYVSEHSTDRANGIYSGISAAVIGARSFKQIVFNVDVTGFGG